MIGRSRLLSLVSVFVLFVGAGALALPASPASAVDTSNDCDVTYVLMAQWPGGFQSQVTLRNLGEDVTSGWEVTLQFHDGQVVRPPWDPIGIPPMPGDPLVVRNLPWNGAIPVNGAVSFSLLGTYSGMNRPPTITCTLFI
jgi:hypothetical protein